MMWRQEDNLWKSVICPRDQIQFVRFGGSSLYLLSCLASPFSHMLKETFLDQY